MEFLKNKNKKINYCDPKKSLDRIQLRLSTIEKKGYETYFALKIFEYRLRYLHITLKINYKV